MLTQDVLPYILAKMTQSCKLTKSRQRFIIELFRVVFAMRGRVNFTNMARFCSLSERTLRRHFAKFFDWVAFNMTIMRLSHHQDEPLIGVFDASFLPKSGKHTYGLDKFFSSLAGANRYGLEVSILGCISTISHRVWTLDVTQTPPGLSQQESAPYSRIDFYLEQLSDLLSHLPQIQYWVGDGQYARRKVFEALTSRGKTLISKLRTDANIRLVINPERERGRYGGKLRWGDWSMLEQVGLLDDLPHVRVYTALVNSAHFKRDLRLVVLVNERDGHYALICSTDVNQHPEEIIYYYRLRYRLEFCIRDAKQFAGLSHCQARDEVKIDFHVNMSFAAVNLVRLMCQKFGGSINSYVREAYNTFIVENLITQLSLEAEFDISHPRIRPVIQIGRMAA